MNKTLFAAVGMAGALAAGIAPAQTTTHSSAAAASSPAMGASQPARKHLSARKLERKHHAQTRHAKDVEGGRRGEAASAPTR